MVRGFVVKPGDDSGFLGEILRVDTVRVDLSWVSLVQRKKRFERLEISGVTGEVSIELLKVLLKKNVVSETQQRGLEENTPRGLSEYFTVWNNSSKRKRGG